MTDRRAYLFIYNDDVGTREEIRDYLDELPEVLNWRYDMPYAFYVISRCSAQEIAEKIHEFADDGRFLIVEVAENKQGWLPRRTWTLLNEAALPRTSAGRPKRRTANATQNQRGLSEVG